MSGQHYLHRRPIDILPAHDEADAAPLHALALLQQRRERCRASALRKRVGGAEIEPDRFGWIFNVPAAISIALNRTINIQGEIVPRSGRADSPGVGWIASIEKTVLRHRFAFTVGNLRATTVDQYVASDFSGLSPKSYFFGFNLVRQWKL